MLVASDKKENGRKLRRVAKSGRLKSPLEG
jgi:hypothetical protein